MNREEAGRLVAVCVATWSSHPVGDPAALVTAWEMALADVPYPLGQRALGLYLREGRFFPAPAEVRALVVDQLGVIPEEGEAWRMVVARMRTTYPGIPAAPWAAPEPVRLAVEAMGGMHVLRLSDDPGDDQKRFFRVYRTYRQRAARELDVAALTAGGGEKALPDGEPSVSRAPSGRRRASEEDES